MNPRQLRPILLCILVLCFSARAQEIDYGLRFTTYPEPAAQFSSLVLNDGLPLPTHGKRMTMEFQLYTRDVSLFGTVFRILSDKGNTLDLVYSINAPVVHCINLVDGDEVTPVTHAIPLDRWIPVRISVDPADGEVTLAFGEESLILEDSGMKGARHLRYSFGQCPYENFTTNDLPSMDVRDIRLLRGKKLLREWKLGVHRGDVCLDEVHGIPARSTNPQWLIDKYVTWEHCLSLQLHHEPSVCFDADSTFYITEDGKSIRVFTTPSRQLTSFPVTGTYPVNAPDQLVWTAGEAPLLAYNLDDNSYAFLNLEERVWKGGSLPVSEHDYWNKTSGWFREGGLLCSFGGYGHYQYNNNLVRVDPTRPEFRTDTPLEEIDPRYSSASCIVDSLMYIFGGRGNKTGKQELSPRNFYDLYEVNLRTLAVRKCWERKTGPDDIDFVPGAGMIFNPEERCFYVLSNIDGFTLFKIGMDEPLFERMSLAIPSGGHGQYVFKGLFLSAPLGKLYAVNNYSKVGGESLLNIYELAYPPYPAAFVEQGPAPARERIAWKTVLPYVIAGLGILMLVAAAVWYFSGKSRKRRGSTGAAQDTARPLAPRYYDTSVSSICFFGGFRVTDREGTDITAQFTPTLKTLLILLILHTAKNPAGIISGKLNSLLWSYKDEDAANNNRNVYMSKLRALLDKVGDIKIINQSKFWRIAFGEDCFCDYLEARRLFAGAGDDEAIDRLMELLLGGMMLPNLELDWVDEFKSEFSNETIDFLTRQLKRDDLDEKNIIQAVETIFQHDYLNEDALKAKCSILYRQGKAGLAKNCYDTFCKEYEKALGIPYGIPFKTIVAS